MDTLIINPMHKIQTLIICLLLAAPVLAEPHPGQDKFIRRAVQEQGLDQDLVTGLLSDARYQQSIIDAITRPAEAKPWYEYRPIFLTRERIDLGVQFWREHRELIRQASMRSDVDEAIIVAIIGVETKYGRITGSYRVLDALATLGFYYPKRAEFFSNELLEFIRLGQEEDLPLKEVKGSYAGAMGLGQFIPSSYRAYAVDFDQDGQRDLWRSAADAIGSVANYFNAHHWKMDQPVAMPADASGNLDRFQAMKPKPASTVGEIRRMGLSVETCLDPGTPASVQILEQKNAMDYWLTFHNFYVITRYNRSPLYAMAVFQLSEEIKARMEKQ